MATTANLPHEESGSAQEWLNVRTDVYRRISDVNDFVRAVFSGRRRNFHPDFERIDVRPVLIKGQLKLQVEFSGDHGVITKNLSPDEFEVLSTLDSGFANILVETRDESLQIRIGKRGQIFRKSSRVSLAPSYEHDQKKTRFLSENDPFLIHVGISDSTGKIKPSMRDKYLQVEEFLKILDTSMETLLKQSDPIRVVDLGCGHAYLTFAAFRLLQLKGRKFSFVGVDVREQTRSRNESIANSLGIADQMRFVDAAISEFPVTPVDIVIALHACDTATDDALAWAVASRSKIILAAPCCHHHLHKQIKSGPEALNPIFEHGILAVRQIDLLTDALRAMALEVVGFNAEVFEFISGDHTARNLMIRAIDRTGAALLKQRQLEKLREYRHTCALWGIKPALEERLKLGDIPLND